MPTKLCGAQKHLLKLVDKGCKESPDGWAPVSYVVYPLLQDEVPPELIVLEWGTDNKHRARLTELGANIIMAMEWLC